MEENQDVELKMGDTPTLRIDISVSNGGFFNGNAKGFWQLAKTLEGTGKKAINTKSTDEGTAIFKQDATTKQWSLNVPLTINDTNRAPGVYHHTAYVIEPGGMRSHVMEGKFVIAETITG